MRGERHQELREVEIGRERHKRLEVMGEKRAKGFKKPWMTIINWKVRSGFPQNLKIGGLV